MTLMITVFAAVISTPVYPLMLDPEVRRGVNEYFMRLGFYYTALDLGGYKTGNMNRGIR